MTRRKKRDPILGFFRGWKPRTKVKNPLKRKNNPFMAIVPKKKTTKRKAGATARKNIYSGYTCTKCGRRITRVSLKMAQGQPYHRSCFDKERKRQIKVTTASGEKRSLPMYPKW